MNKVSRVKNKNFTTISNVFLRDKDLSIKSKGFLAVVMGLPDDWEFSINGICSILKEGKTAIYNTIDELKQLGYCKVVTNRDLFGRIIGNDYMFFEEPQQEEQYLDKPYMENPNMDNQPQLNKEIIKETIEEKKEIIKEKSCEDEFVERMYALYPTKCPKRNTTLRKCSNDKKRIQKLLKMYSMEDIEFVIRKEIEEKYGKHYMSNFSTFLNNFPDPNSLRQVETTTTIEENDTLIINGQIYK